LREGFGFLANLTEDELTISRDQYQHEEAAVGRVRAGIVKKIRTL
jgi:hypothetical protein